MKVSDYHRNFFSENSKSESSWRVVSLVLFVITSAILILYWDPLGLQKYIEPLFYFQAERPLVEYLFRAITFIGDDEFFMLFLSVLIWSVHKSLGYWTAVALLLAGAYTFQLKEMFAVPRPDLGIQQPGNDAFPSGHTLSTFVFWGYMATRIKTTRFWIWTVSIVVLMGLSRMILGYHFVRDILGGLTLGFVFLVVFILISALVIERGWVEKFKFPALLVISIIAPILLTVLLSDDVGRLMGYLAGISVGYVLEKEKIGYLTKGLWHQHALRILLGWGVMFAIVLGLSGVLTSEVLAFAFIRYALAGFWVTFVAPLIFTRIGLAECEGESS